MRALWTRISTAVALASALALLIAAAADAGTRSLPATAAAADAGAGPLPAFTSGNGITVQSVQRLDDRLDALTVTTGAVDGPLHIRVLLPDGYAQHPTRRYPVLYLVHGTSGGAADWTDQGAAEATTAGRPLITVMPDIGVNDNGGGYCTNWFNGGRGGQPLWETFEIGQVIPFIDRVLRTRANRGGRAIAGLSQGGFCALSLAARHPDMFAAAASFSGAIDTAGDPLSEALMTPIIQGTTTGLDGVSDPDAMFGPRASQEINWAAHDPATLVSNLRGMRLWAYTGNGQPGPLDPIPVNPGAAGIETGVHILSAHWKAAADAAGVPVAYTDYGPGTHSWPYWKRDLQWVIGPLSAVLSSPPAPPALTAYTTAENPWSQWGYQVAISRPAREFSTLSRAGAAGFELGGSGTATVLTPGQYRRGSRHRVRMTGPYARRSLIARADRRGRLHLRVPLGPGNPDQQDTAAAQAAGGTHVYTTAVWIGRALRPAHRRAR
ncbi:MAG TPA: alpha/beta hydrolase-fold protein [Solirubrobacteraceae bacterium]|nr:alpha/beta hydrolase-fold protein [Solirubrobacteraceae bacterium]